MEGSEGSIIYMIINKNKLRKEKTSNYQYRGLTLIEMVVSLAVVMFIATIFIFNYRDNNKRTDLIMSSQVMVSNVHRAQNNALGLLQYGTEVPAGGWGVYFDTDTPNRYIIFPDLQGPGESGHRIYEPGLEGDISKGTRIIDLPPEIVISDIHLYEDGPSRTSASVTFLPPDPRTNIYSGGATSSELFVDLEDKRSGTIRTMLINFLGLSEIFEPLDVVE